VLRVFNSSTILLLCHPVFPGASSFATVGFLYNRLQRLGESYVTAECSSLPISSPLEVFDRWHDLSTSGFPEFPERGC
jgi:hypothetical protein